MNYFNIIKVRLQQILFYNNLNLEDSSKKLQNTFSQSVIVLHHKTQYLS